MEEFYIDSDGTKLHAKLDRPEGFTRGPLCILIHGFTGHMEEDHIIAAQKAMNVQGEMKIVHVNEMIMEIFEVTGFSDIMTIE